MTFLATSKLVVFLQGLEQRSFPFPMAAFVPFLKLSKHGSRFLELNSQSQAHLSVRINDQYSFLLDLRHILCKQPGDGCLPHPTLEVDRRHPFHSLPPITRDPEWSSQSRRLLPSQGHPFRSPQL